MTKVIVYIYVISLTYYIIFTVIGEFTIVKDAFQQYWLSLFMDAIVHE